MHLVWYCIVTNDPKVLLCILLNCILVVLSDTKMPCLNCYIVKRILISFNCFSEYILKFHALMDSSFRFDTMKLGWSFVSIEEAQDIFFPNKLYFFL